MAADKCWFISSRPSPLALMCWHFGVALPTRLPQKHINKKKTNSVLRQMGNEAGGLVVMKSNNIKLTELWWIVAAWPETTFGKWEMWNREWRTQNVECWMVRAKKHFGESPFEGPHYFSLGRKKHLIYGLVSRKNLLFRFMALCSLLLPTFIYLSFIPTFSVFFFFFWFFVAH